MRLIAFFLILTFTFANANLYVSANDIQKAAQTDNGGSEKQKSIRIGSGASDGGYFKIAQILRSTQIKNDGKPRRIMTISTGGSITNIKALKNGEFSLGFSQGNIAHDAYKGIGLFTEYGAVDNLRSIARLYPEYLFIVTRADSKLDSLHALKGKHVGLGSAGSGTLETTMRVLSSHGINESDMNGHFGRIQQIISDFKNNKVEAFFYVGAYPSQILDTLNEEVPIKLINIRKDEITRLTKENLSILYANLDKPFSSQSDVNTISLEAQLFTRDDMPEEEIYLLTKHMWKNSAKSKHPINPKLALNNLEVPLHPGAERYYREIKALRK